MRLTDRDRDILEVLTVRVRLLTVAQAARTWWGAASSPRRSALGRIRALEAGGFLERVPVLARPELDLSRSAAAWHPGESSPNLGRLSYELAERWSVPARRTACVVATPQARSRHKSRGQWKRAPRVSEATHDIHLAGVYLRFRREQPERAACWVPEEGLLERGWGRERRLPDALIDGPEEKTAIEFVGRYSKRKLEDFHAFCELEGLAYELW